MTTSPDNNAHANEHGHGLNIQFLRVIVSVLIVGGAAFATPPALAMDMSGQAVTVASPRPSSSKKTRKDKPSSGISYLSEVSHNEGRNNDNLILYEKGVAALERLESTILSERAKAEQILDKEKKDAVDQVDLTCSKAILTASQAAQVALFHSINDARQILGIKMPPILDTVEDKIIILVSAGAIKDPRINLNKL